MDAGTSPVELVPLVQNRYDAFLSLLQTLVNCDSGSFSPDGVNHVADLCEARLRSTGWAVERLVHEPGSGAPRLGDVLIGRRRGTLPVAAGGRRLLLLAHMDTVFDDGTAAERPFRIAGSRAYGPGVGDDKHGVVAGIEAVEALCDDAGFSAFAEITLVCSPDEEIGSPFSGPVIRRLAAEHDVALGLESARSGGEVVSARKGVFAFAVEITGRASHAGARPEDGINAALEAAHTTVALHALTGRWPGVTCNVGVVRAGSRPNIVPAHAELEVDLRAPTEAAFAAARAAVDEIVAEPSVTGARSRIRTLHHHVPWEKTEAVAALVREAQYAAKALGFTVGDLATGGAGDANTTAACGLPTLDGLAPIGRAAHTDRECLYLDSVVPRISLLAALIARLGRDGRAPRPAAVL
jgi:glutamate carboxypeptidase